MTPAEYARFLSGRRKHPWEPLPLQPSVWVCEDAILGELRPPSHLQGWKGSGYLLPRPLCLPCLRGIRQAPSPVRWEGWAPDAWTPGLDGAWAGGASATQIPGPGPPRGSSRPRSVPQCGQTGGRAPTPPPAPATSGLHGPTALPRPVSLTRCPQGRRKAQGTYNWLCCALTTPSPLASTVQESEEVHWGDLRPRCQLARLPRCCSPAPSEWPVGGRRPA